jgi:photosystem II stability/assembly factor-like uncharacterized protein
VLFAERNVILGKKEAAMKAVFFILISITFSLSCLSLRMKSFGQTWTEQTSNVTTQLTSVSAVDANNAWVCGYSGVVLRTTNGGTNWVSVGGGPIPATLNLHNIFAPDANTAVVLGSGADAFAFRTTNGGTLWTQVLTQAGGFFNAVWFANPFAGFLMGDPVGGRWSLWGTINGGASWDSAGFYLPQAGAEAGWNNSFFFSGTSVWFGTDNTRVYYSPNLTIWTPQPTTGQVNSYAIWFNGLTGMTGGTGTMISTGGTWSNTVSPLPGTANISGITGDGVSFWVTRQTTAIYRTTNNGANWLTVYTAPAGNYRHIQVARLDNTIIWAVRTNGGITKGVNMVGIKEISGQIPLKFELFQNYPNPFNAETVIR